MPRAARLDLLGAPGVDPTGDLAAQLQHTPGALLAAASGRTSRASSDRASSVPSTGRRRWRRPLDRLCRGGGRPGAVPPIAATATGAPATGAAPAPRRTRGGSTGRRATRQQQRHHHDQQQGRHGNVRASAASSCYLRISAPGPRIAPCAVEAPGGVAGQAGRQGGARCLTPPADTIRRCRSSDHWPGYNAQASVHGWVKPRQACTANRNDMSPSRTSTGPRCAAGSPPGSPALPQPQPRARVGAPRPARRPGQGQRPPARPRRRRARLPAPGSLQCGRHRQCRRAGGGSRWTRSPRAGVSPVRLGSRPPDPPADARLLPAGPAAAPPAAAAATWLRGPGSAASGCTLPAASSPRPAAAAAGRRQWRLGAMQCVRRRLAGALPSGAPRRQGTRLPVTALRWACIALWQLLRGPPGSRQIRSAAI